jgi:hypothetical protein
MYGISPRRFACWLIAVTATTVLSTAACYPSEEQPGSIVVEHEVFLPGFGGTPNVLAQMPNGRLVVAGGWGSAWALALDQTGKTVWQFEESKDPAVRFSTQSEYRGAVPLANGNLLLCGEKQIEAGGRGLVTVLGADGRVVEERELIAQNNAEFFSSEWRHCFAWDGGILLIGAASRSQGTVGWLMKLNANGGRVSERLDGQLVASSVTAGAAGTLVFADFDSRSRQTRLLRVNEHLEVVDRREIPSSGFGLLRSTASVSGIELIAYQVSLKATLYSLGEHLEDVRAPHAIDPIYIDKGRGYVLADNSLALFGYIYRGGPYTAAIARINAAAATDSIYMFAPQFDSFTVGDAMPVGPRRFITVRMRAGKTAAESGSVLSWVSFK